jgi:hypothetical protein
MNEGCILQYAYGIRLTAPIFISAARVGQVEGRRTW